MGDVPERSASQPKSTAGWVFGGLSFIPLFGVLFGIVAIIIGAVRRTRGQIYLGIGGILFSVLLYGGIFYFGFIAKTGPFAALKVTEVPQLINIDAGQIALYKLNTANSPKRSAIWANRPKRICSTQPIPGGRNSNIPSLGTTTSN